MSTPLPKSGTRDRPSSWSESPCTRSCCRTVVVDVSVHRAAPLKNGSWFATRRKLALTLRNRARTTAPGIHVMPLEQTFHEATRLLGTDRASIFISGTREQKELVACPALGVRRANPRLLGIMATSVSAAIRADDAYDDSRFNKEVDVKTYYKTPTQFRFDGEQHQSLKSSIAKRAISTTTIDIASANQIQAAIAHKHART